MYTLFDVLASTWKGYSFARLMSRLQLMRPFCLLINDKNIREKKMRNLLLTDDWYANINLSNLKWKHKERERGKERKPLQSDWPVNVCACSGLLFLLWIERNTIWMLRIETSSNIMIAYQSTHKYCQSNYSISIILTNFLSHLPNISFIQIHWNTKKKIATQTIHQTNYYLAFSLDNK